MARPKILIQLDPDPQPSVFDAVVAVDAGVDQLLRHGGVTPDQVTALVHGAIFTRGPKELKNTALFIGGSDVAAAERLLEAATAAFFGPMRVSVMLDASGANTTAAAAVLAAGQHVQLQGTTALVLAATGPVGQRLVRLLAHEGVSVRVASRSAARAQTVCQAVAQRVARAALTPMATSEGEQLAAAVDGADLVFAAGAAGVRLLPEAVWQHAAALRVAIDLNAVPPTGIEAIEPTDRAIRRGQVVCYGALGIGAAKMQIHKAAVRQLFEASDQVLDAEQILQIGRRSAAEQP